ncbi:putative protein family UPF0646 [Metarhizium rileyi]|uniref:Uncharacterized protein n=1 Tax=Metarhizium rileyi (strain RCEF 4871) TaxID=1649241 RepID=A0A167F655_METRR|nr:putative protein family UPF0646 [Metarhizium rileyi RCEF 4871]
MEVNAAPRFGLDKHLDDDLINYDSDTEKPLGHSEILEATHVTETAEYEKLGHEVADGEDPQDEVDFFEGDEQDEAAKDQLELRPKNEIQDTGLQASHEIDYNFDEPTDHESREAIHGDVRKAASEQQHLDEIFHDEQVQGYEEVAYEAENHEISWEREDEPVDESLQEQETIANKVDYMSPNEPPTSEKETQIASGYYGDAAAGAGDSYSDYLEAAGDEMEDDEDIQSSVKQDVPSDLEYSDVDENGVPAITVQYKGDEYPFFSLSSEGFFSQLSMLDCNLESVLSGLRDELANELLPEDDLVFQVDELGLEFAESSSSDTLSNITLRQILEVFEILVKNQDPESGRRSLYTYLFTRPSTGRRFDFLMESATEGKGLDEIAHLFRPPLSRSTDPRDVSVDGNLNTQLDGDDGSDEDCAAPEIRDGSSGQATPVKPLEGIGEEAEDEDEDEEDSLPDHQESFAEDYGEDEPANKPGESVTQDDNGIEGLEPSDISPHFDEAVVSGTLAPEDDVGDGERDVEQLHDEDAQEAGDEVHNLIGLDFDGLAEAANTNLSEQFGQDDVESANAMIGGADASTRTTTLKDDGESTGIPAELVALDAIIDEAAVDDVVGQDDLAEIDWRDEAEAHLHDEVDGDESSGAVKRARGDDELGADDSKNAKRQRS